MMMIKSLTFDISIHDILNPPEGNRGSNLNMNLSFRSAKNVLTFIPKSNNNRDSTYSIQVATHLDYDLIGRREVIVEEFIEDLVLSLNLVLKRGCVNRYDVKPHSIRIEYEETRNLSSVSKEPGKTITHLWESVGFGESVNVVVLTHDEIDELEVLEVLKKIIRLRRHERKNTVREINLCSSIENYEKAMESLEEPFKFRFLFNSLELVVNVSGRYLTGDHLHREVNRVTGIPAEDVRDWAQFYNRLRHAQGSEGDIEKFIRGTDKFITWMLSLRECNKQLIKSQLF